jgi:hypothetical protein
MKRIGESTYSGLIMKELREMQADFGERERRHFSSEEPGRHVARAHKLRALYVGRTSCARSTLYIGRLLKRLARAASRAATASLRALRAFLEERRTLPRQ